MKLLKKEAFIPEEGWRKKLFKIIYFADSPAGKFFDVCLLISIVASTLLIIWESVPGSYDKYNSFFIYSEWTLTILFTIEYYLRVVAIKNNKAYVLSCTVSLGC